MTTAHRPTWQAAKGSEEQGGSRIFAPLKQFSAKDQAAHTTLKTRSTSHSFMHFMHFRLCASATTQSRYLVLLCLS